MMAHNLSREIQMISAPAAQPIRTILSAAAGKIRKRYVLEIVE